MPFGLLTLNKIYPGTETQFFIINIKTLVGVSFFNVSIDKLTLKIFVYCFFLKM